MIPTFIDGFPDIPTGDIGCAVAFGAGVFDFTVTVLVCVLVLRTVIVVSGSESVPALTTSLTNFICSGNESAAPLGEDGLPSMSKASILFILSICIPG
jgi:hypothetical protein